LHGTQQSQSWLRDENNTKPGKLKKTRKTREKSHRQTPTNHKTLPKGKTRSTIIKKLNGAQTWHFQTNNTNPNPPPPFFKVFRETNKINSKQTIKKKSPQQQQHNRNTRKISAKKIAYRKQKDVRFEPTTGFRLWDDLKLLPQRCAGGKTRMKLEVC
jgi:hypothetical protein